MMRIPFDAVLVVGHRQEFLGILIVWCPVLHKPGMLPFDSQLGNNLMLYAGDYELKYC